MSEDRQNETITQNAICTSVPKQPELDTRAEKEYISRTSKHELSLTNANPFAIVFTYHHFDE